MDLLNSSGFFLPSTSLTLHEKCPYSEFFWSVFSHIWTEYWKNPYLSVFSPNAGKYGPKNSEYGHFSRSVNLSFIFYVIYRGTEIYWLFECSHFETYEKKVLHISLDKCCSRFEILLQDSIFKLMMLVENSVVLKNQVSCNFMLQHDAKIWHHNFIPTTCKNFESVF